MYNTYFSSALFSLKSKSSSCSYSFNDYSTLPSSSCACCSCCCAFATQCRLPVYPSCCLYGLRQSSLIQCSPSRRLILGCGGGGDRFRFPVHDVGRGGYEVSVKRRNDNGGGFGRRKGGYRNRIRPLVLEVKSDDFFDVGGFDDAEAVISLLSEEFNEEYLRGGERIERLGRRLGKSKVNAVKREDYGCGVGRRERDEEEVKKREKYRDDRQRRDMGGSKSEFESMIELREEGYRKNEDSDDIKRGELYRGRSKSASSSSYHSFEEYESDKDVQDEERMFVDDSVSGQEDGFKAEVKEEICRYNDDVERHGKLIEQKYTGGGNRVEWDCRKKSEKKLTEVVPEETQSNKESSEIHLRRDRIHETDYAEASSSRKQMSEERKSSLAVNLEETRRQYNQMGIQDRKQYNQMGLQDTTQSDSRWRCEEITDTTEIHGTDAETTNESERTSQLFRHDNLRRKSQQGSRKSEIVDVERERISNLQRHSESRMKIREDNETSHKGFIQGTEEQYRQRDERIVRQVDTDSKRSSLVQSQTRMKDQDKHTRLVSSSYPEARREQSQMDRRNQERPQSRKEAQDSTSLSVVQASDMNMYSQSERAAEERITSQQSTLTLVVDPVRETRERRKQTAEKGTQTMSLHEAPKPTRITTSVKPSGEGSSSQSSLDLISQAGVQHSYVDEEGNSQAMLMPSPSQLVAKGSVSSDQTGRTAAQELSSKSSESGSTIFYSHSGGRTPDFHDESRSSRWVEASDEPLDHISPEDGLGSAQRLEESSMQVFGEFVEQARHKASTSELRKEKKAAESEVMYEGENRRNKIEGQVGFVDSEVRGQGSRESPESSGAEGPLELVSHEDDPNTAYGFEESSLHFVGELADKQRQGVSAAEMQREKKATKENVAYEGAMQLQKKTGQYGSEDTQLKRNESKRLSGSSGAKGPYDEMWHVTDPSVQPPETEAPKDNVVAETAIVKRSGKSLWSIIGNIVRLRFGSHTETPTTAARSEGKNSSNESVSSEAWFSGRESDKNSDKNVKEERRVVPQEATPALQPIPMKASIPAEGEVRTDMASSSKDEKSFQGTSSDMDIVPISSRLPATVIGKPPSVEEISETGRSETSAGGSSQSNVRLTEVSGSAIKGGELKQRKLQRAKQVIDRFDEWEEAFLLESEQRKIDEIFMREALLEAKKAADIWEVPVGAVLVQDGKIIARGYNL